MTLIRDPRQVKQLDDVTLRREMKALLPATLILDDEERRELCDLSNGAARYNHLRVKLLRASLYGEPKPRQLAPMERAQLGSFILNGGARPSFARLASADAHYGPQWLAPGDPDAPKPGPAWPEQSTREAGRYIEPKGDFAIPSDRQ